MLLALLSFGVIMLLAIVAVVRLRRAGRDRFVPRVAPRYSPSRYDDAVAPSPTDLFDSLPTLPVTADASVGETWSGGGGDFSGGGASGSWDGGCDSGGDSGGGTNGSCGD